MRLKDAVNYYSSLPSGRAAKRYCHQAEVAVNFQVKILSACLAKEDVSATPLKIHYKSQAQRQGDDNINKCTFWRGGVWNRWAKISGQDAFDHDKGQKSAISGRRLHWRLSTGFFAFSSVFICNLVRRAP